MSLKSVRSGHPLQQCTDLKLNRVKRHLAAVLPIDGTNNPLRPDHLQHYLFIKEAKTAFFMIVFKHWFIVVVSGIISGRFSSFTLIFLILDFTCNVLYE